MSTTAFDPYSQWLGIHEGPRPPDYYTLLGLERFESDPTMIARAADMQLARLRRVRPGPWAALWSRLLDDIKEAKRCLTNPGLRTTYDAALAASSGFTSAPGLPAASQILNENVSPEGRLVPEGWGPSRDDIGRVPFPVGYGGGAGNPAFEAAKAEVPMKPSPPIVPLESGVSPGHAEELHAQQQMPVAASVIPTVRTRGEVLASPPQSMGIGGAVGSVPTAAFSQARPIPVATAPATTGGPIGQSEPLGAVAVNEPAAAVATDPYSAARRSNRVAVVFRWAVVLGLLIVLGILAVELRNRLLSESDSYPTASAGNHDSKPLDHTARAPGSDVRAAADSPAPPQRPVGIPTSPTVAPLVPSEQTANTTTAPSVAASKEADSSDANGVEPVTPPTLPPDAHQGPGKGTRSPVNSGPGGGQNSNTNDAATSSGEDSQKKSAFRKVLTEARFAMAEREYADARKALQSARGLIQSETDRKEFERLDQLLTHLDGFWKSIREVMPKLDGTEMPIGNTYISIVEADENHVLVKAAGQMRRYGVGTPDMPVKLITAIAERNFKADAAWCALYGTFHAMDRDGDRARARELWQRAGRLGAELLPELDVARESAIHSSGNSRNSANGGAATSASAGVETNFAESISSLQQQAEQARSIAQHSEVARKALAECQRACAARRWDDAIKLAQIAQAAARESKSPALMRQAFAATQQIEAVRNNRN